MYLPAGELVVQISQLDSELFEHGCVDALDGDVGLRLVLEHLGRLDHARELAEVAASGEGLDDNDFACVHMHVDVDLAVNNNPNLVEGVACLHEHGIFLVVVGLKRVKDLFETIHRQVLEVVDGVDNVEHERLPLVFVRLPFLFELGVHVREQLAYLSESFDRQRCTGAVVHSLHRGCSRAVRDDGDLSEQLTWAKDLDKRLFVVLILDKNSQFSF
mmetsp:Transcript_33777/g.38922  ORF Transcript_33777/g.38922 Transcript_33777/m.38922 type:complete len:216 (+) Transcript_33777:576-1223(+)